MIPEKYMPLHRRLLFVVLTFLAIALAGLGFALTFGDGESVRLVHYATWTQEHDAFLRAFTDLGLYPFYFLFLALYAWGYYREEAGLRLLAGGYLLSQIIASVLIVRSIKILFGRARPDFTSLPDFGSEWVGFSWDAAHHSFPSGHTGDIVVSALFATLLFRSPWMAGISILWAVALGLSRLALAEHYPSDALASTVIALSVSILVVRYWLLPRLSRVKQWSAPLWWWQSAEKHNG